MHAGSLKYLLVTQTNANKIGKTFEKYFIEDAKQLTLNKLNSMFQIKNRWSLVAKTAKHG